MCFFIRITKQMVACDPDTASCLECYEFRFFTVVRGYFFPPPLAAFFCPPSPLHRRRVRIGFGVVLVVVNLAALLILLMLHVIVLCRRQMAAIRFAIVVHFVVDGGFVMFDVRSFTRRQLRRSELPD